MTDTKNSWEVIVEQDEHGELILPLPQDLLDQQGWKEGDELTWTDRGNGTWEISKVSTVSTATSTVDRVC